MKFSPPCFRRAMTSTTIAVWSEGREPSQVEAESRCSASWIGCPSAWPPLRSGRTRPAGGATITPIRAGRRLISVVSSSRPVHPGGALTGGEGDQPMTVDTERIDAERERIKHAPSVKRFRLMHLRNFWRCPLLRCLIIPLLGFNESWFHYVSFFRFFKCTHTMCQNKW